MPSHLSIGCEFFSEKRADPKKCYSVIEGSTRLDTAYHENGSFKQGMRQKAVVVRDR